MATALEYAVKLLSMTSMSKARLEEKLMEKGFPADDSQIAVLKLSELGLIDDGAYAASLVRSLKKRGYGVMRVRRELEKKGVDRDVSAEAAADFEADRDFLDRFISQKSAGQPVSGQLYGKIARALASRGFTWDEISAALQRHNIRNEEWQ